jgi:hypothetical protein
MTSESFWFSGDLPTVTDRLCSGRRRGESYVQPRKLMRGRAAQNKGCPSPWSTKTGRCHDGKLYNFPIDV